MKLSYTHTRYASYCGYVTQAIVNNLSPLLFVSFQREFGISIEQIGFMVAMNFAIQIVVDLLAVRFVDKIGYRLSAVGAHIFCTLGLICMGILPNVLPNAFAGLLIAVLINALGGGLIEVLISPIVESLPGDEKASAMSLLHSFYCWGHVGVVLLSTLYFNLAGVQNWHFLPVLWAIVPLVNAILFFKVPLRTLAEGHEAVPLRKLFSIKIFWLLLILMICAGASEQAVSQWSSLFAESGLGISKTLGDLLGPCAFAVLMGLARAAYGVYGSRFNIKRVLMFSSGCCVASYLLMVFSPIPLLSLAGCALCGLFVGIMWPGTTSLSAEYYPGGGTAMFAMLALAGDIGCSTGPALVSVVSNGVETAKITITQNLFSGQSLTEMSIKTGLLAAVLFPLLMLTGVLLLRKKPRQQNAPAGNMEEAEPV